MSKPISNSAPHIGVHVAGFSFREEGIDHVLDSLRETCSANALHLYAHTYHGFAPWVVSQGIEHTPVIRDHGVNPAPRPPGKMTSVWYRSRADFYPRPELAPQLDADCVYGDRDIFDDLAEPAARRGMKLYARVCEWGCNIPTLPGFENWHMVHLDGQSMPFCCLNHPEYRAWQIGMMSDLFTDRPHLAGLNFGWERGSVLNGVLSGGNPTCFCPHCLDRNARRGINEKRARAGFRALSEWAEAAALPDPEALPDGRLVTLLRHFMEYPETLAWDRSYVEAQHEISTAMYAAIKAVSPTAEVGWHIFQQMSFNPIFRAEFNYAEFVPFADYIKPVLYHNCAGARIENWFLDRHGPRILGDFPPNDRLRIAYHLLRYDPAREPTDVSASSGVPGFSPDYVRREVARCVRTSGKPVYAGLGLDIPDLAAAPPTSESIAGATRAAFEGGASGLILSREYHEMDLESLRAVGRSLRSLGHAS